MASYGPTKTADLDHAAAPSASPHRRPVARFRACVAAAGGSHASRQQAREPLRAPGALHAPEPHRQRPPRLARGPGREVSWSRRSCFATRPRLLVLAHARLAQGAAKDIYQCSAMKMLHLAISRTRRYSAHTAAYRFFHSAHVSCTSGKQHTLASPCTRMAQVTRSSKTYIVMANI